MNLKKKAFENTVGKGENAGNPLFLPFSTVFSTLSKREIIVILAMLNMLSANAFNLIMSKILLFDTGVKLVQFEGICRQKLEIVAECDLSQLTKIPKFKGRSSLNHR